MQTSRVAGRCLNGQDCGLLCITQMLHLGECVDGDGDKGQPQLSPELPLAISWGPDFPGATREAP